MKQIYLMSGFLCVALTLHAQDCKKLADARFFRTIQFGKKVPSALVDCAGSSNTGRLQYDSLNTICQKKYEDVFQFMSSGFSFVSLWQNDQGQLYGADLWIFIDPPARADSAEQPAGKFPAGFTRIYDKLIAAYGKPTTTEDSYDMVMKKTRHSVWECTDIRLDLRVTFGADRKDLNVLEIIVENRKFEFVRQVQDK